MKGHRWSLVKILRRVLSLFCGLFKLGVHSVFENLVFNRLSTGSVLNVTVFAVAPFQQYRQDSRGLLKRDMFNSDISCFQDTLALHVFVNKL